MRREGTWPVEDLYWPGYTATWKSLYDRFGLDFASSLDLSEPDEYWQRYLYFNAGWFLGPDPAAFGARFTDWALSVRNSPPPELALQPLDPWLDQVVLPLVIHSFGGGRPGPELAGLDGDAPATTGPCRCSTPANPTARSRCWSPFPPPTASRNCSRNTPHSAR